MKIRITGTGIYGLPITDESPNGEYPVGHVLDIGDNEPPAGWAGRYEVVGAKADKDAEFIANPSLTDRENAEREAAFNGGATDKNATDKGDLTRDEANKKGTESKDEADQPRRGRPKG